MSEKKFLYQKVYSGIADKISDGTLGSGDKIPTDQELSQEYGVSAITVKKALSMLCENGVIRRVQGKGSFVSQIEKPVVKTSKSMIIGVILEHVATPFGLDLLYNLDHKASENGYKIFVRFTYGNRKKENEEIEYLVSMNVDGLIVMPTHGFHFNTTLLKLILDGFPVVLIDKELKGIPVATVINDNRAATGMLVEYLQKIGKKNIALVTTFDEDTSSIADRIRGFYDTVEALGLQALPQCSVSRETYFMNKKPNNLVVESIEKYLKENIEQLEAVVCAEYSFVPDVLSSCQRLGIHLPEDLTVCCIDEDYLAPNGYSFTHAKQNEKEIAEKAVELMVDQIHTGCAQDIIYRATPILRIGRFSNGTSEKGIGSP